MKKTCVSLLCLCLSLTILLAACGSATSTRSVPSGNLTSDSLSQSRVQQSPTPTLPSIPPLSIPSQKAPVPTPTPAPHVSPAGPPPPTSTQPPTSSCITFSNDTTRAPAANGTLAAPYGPAPVTSEAQQIAQQLFQLVNHDRAACGLPAFTWNATLASGALLHSWNMYHAGFSHYVPDGMTPYQRIANEGYAGQSDCGENIGLAGPSNPVWANVYSVQESMANEPLGGWHRIHLFSTTIHSMGIGVYVAPDHWVWFTEDMIS